MNKQEFISELRVRLSGLREKDVEERLGFYSEMIDDRMEEGLSEEEAVADIGSVDEIASQIIAQTPLLKIVNYAIKPKRKMQVWEILLLVLGFPIYISLLASVFAALISVYASVWAVIISLWASAFALLVGGVIAGAVMGVSVVISGNLFAGIALIGGALFCAGFSIFLLFGCKLATKGTVWITKKIVLGIKKIFLGKGEAK